MADALEEHFSYLSDAVRLERFTEAVRRAVRPGDTVADIGCGFGVLGLMCLKAGASHIWGIDSTEAIEIARQTTRRAGFEGRYTCVQESSFRAELPPRVDIVICDHVGYFGFDYGIIAATADARRRLLRPGGRVIPAQIVLQVAAVQSPSCRKQAQAWESAPVPADYHWLSEYGVNSRHPYDFAPEELASAPASVGTIDLREDCPEHLSFSGQLSIERTCELDGLGGWFECEIAEDVWMTNSPLAANRINRHQVFLPFATPLSVVEGDVLEVSISARHQDLQISWTARVVRTGQTTRQSTWASTILHPLDRIQPGDRHRELSPAGAALQSLLSRVDGQTADDEIERAMLHDYPDLFPSSEQIARFVRSELNRNTR